jgi:hypothetical protein
MKEVVLTSETSVHSNETTRRNVPEGSNLYFPVVFPLLLHAVVVGYTLSGTLYIIVAGKYVFLSELHRDIFILKSC